ncbi:unnamed protein product [Adineta ricciae]|uniref:Calcineurin-like phosphoesterase domain-containing protein n=1 Tax=Adineta ricciae TaxID=249248 RepID=A0A815LYT6_ADIRI|nr:unnamed protein product [Adineta ricciae]
MSNMYIGQLPITRLVNDLIKANESRAQQPFIIVVTHRPLLCSDGSELQQHLPNSTLFKTVYPLFVKYQVQLIITGHIHVYERIFFDNTTTITNNTYINVRSPVIIVQGTWWSIR